MHLKCDNCGWIGHALQSEEVRDLEERLSGGPAPDGECPRCGALAYQMRDELFHVFENSEWSDTDRADAQSQGWDLFELDSRGVLQIEAITEAGRFKSDAEAAAYVMGAARLGNKTAVRALLCLADHIVQSYLVYRGVWPSDVATLERAFGTSISPYEETMLRSVYAGHTMQHYPPL